MGSFPASWDPFPTPVAALKERARSSSDTSPIPAPDAIARPTSWRRCAGRSHPGGRLTAAPDPLSETSPILAGIVSASVQGRVALGPRAGARVRRLGDEPNLGHVTSRGPRQAQLDGFDLHANVRIPPHDRVRLERLGRYLLRLPLAQDRVRLLEAFLAAG